MLCSEYSLPQLLRGRALQLAHEGHLGVIGTKQHLRTKVWWPGMDRNDMKCAQEPSSDGEQKGIAEECKINCETIQREEQTPKSYRPQRQIKLPERLGDYVIE